MAANALFAEINKGGAVTSGLKKVTKGEAWDPSKYGGKKAAPAASAAPKFGAAAGAAKPPKLELNGKKWEVEHQVKQSDLKLEAIVKQTVYVYQCQGSTLTISGKCNAVTLDGCKKTMVIFDTVVAGIELINCKDCKVQVKESCQTFTIDSCNGTQVILNAESVGAEVVSAKSSELNIVVPGKEEGDEYKEHPIPEQFVSKYDVAKGAWSTVCMAHTG